MMVFDTSLMSTKIIVGDKPKSWITWEGKKKNVEEIDHQHLSNIYWFNALLYNRVYVFILEELKYRFNSQLLPYRPDIKFTNEISSLSNKGFILRDNGREIIKLNGIEIGEIVHEK